MDLDALKDMNVARQRKWDLDYLALAAFWAGLKSKDPSTKVAAIVVNTNNRIVGMGYNGFPVGVEDNQDRLLEREIKYQYVVHGEPNAILDAGHECRGGTIYVWPLFTCNDCAKLVIQSGIKRVVSPHVAEERWMSAYDVAKSMYLEAGIEITHYKKDQVNERLHPNTR